MWGATPTQTLPTNNYTPTLLPCLMQSALPLSNVKNAVSVQCSLLHWISLLFTVSNANRPLTLLMPLSSYGILLETLYYCVFYSVTRVWLAYYLCSVGCNLRIHRLVLLLGLCSVLDRSHSSDIFVPARPSRSVPTLVLDTLYMVFVKSRLFLISC